MRETVDEKVVKKISELTLEGVRKRGEMRRHLNNFVKNELFKGETPPPSYRRRYYPKRKDLDYYISKAKLENRLAKMDRDNIEQLIAKWQTSTDHSFYFRKRAEVTSCTKTQDFADHSRQCAELENEEDDIDDDEEPEPQPLKTEQTLLLCYQTKEQKRLLLKYGNDMCLLDATYKTTRYALPLFSRA